MGLTQLYSPESAEYSQYGADGHCLTGEGDASRSGGEQEAESEAAQVDDGNDEVGEDCRVVLLSESAETELERRVAILSTGWNCSHGSPQQQATGEDAEDGSGQ